MIFPFRFKVPIDRVPVLTYLLIALNVAAFLGTANGLVVTDRAVEAFALTRENASLFRMLSSSFLHGDILHLLGNMWFLFLAGRATESRLGMLKFLAVYFLGDLAGSSLHLLATSGQPDVPTLGASGAVMSVFGAAIYLFPFSRVTVFYWIGWWFHGFWEWRVWGVGLYYLGFDFVFGLASLGAGESGGVANFAHLGGALGGALVALALKGRRDSADAGEAHSTLTELDGDYRGLSRAQLAAVAQGSGGDWRPNFALVQADVLQGRPPDAQTVSRLERDFPTIVREADPRMYAPIVLMLVERGGLAPSAAVDAGAALMRVHEFLRASELFEAALRTQRLPDADAESATFRLAVARSMNPATKDQAARLFEEVAERWPFGSFSGEALARAAALRA